MLDRRPVRARLVATTLRRIVALALARTFQYALRTIAAPGLVVTIPARRKGHRPNISC
jgi:hypothetical protein